MKRIIVGLATLVVLVGCGSTTSESQPGVMADSATMSAESAPAAEPGVQIITTGYLVLEAPNPIATGLEAQTIVTAANGRVDRSSESRYDDIVSVTLGLRVPASEFATVVDRISQLGTVVNKDISTTDVTTQVLDLDARIAALETSVSRMTDLLQQAETVADLIAAEAALADRQGQLDSLVSQREYLSDQVAMSALTVTITSGSGSTDTSIVLVIGGVLIGIIIGVLVGATWWSRRRRS